ncbi:MAG: EAL domain-containing protein, partial [Achromobacter pestifer]
INGIGRSLDIPTTAEGVETAAQLDRLTEEGCSHFQGYLLGRPVSHDTSEDAAG